MVIDVGAAIKSARTAAGLSRCALADRLGISQSTVNRILSGDRPAKMTEIIEIADAVGCTVSQLTGNAVADRVLCAAPALDVASIATMRQRLRHLMELDAYLDDQGFPAVR